MSLPIQIDLQVNNDGTVKLGGSPPLYYVETSILPVFHQLKINIQLNRIETGSIGQAQILLCSDFFYAKVESLVLADLLDKWRERSVTILIGDGGRAFVPKDYREVLWEESVDVDSDLEGREKRTVRILRY